MKGERRYIFVFLCAAIVVLAGCGTKKNLTKRQESVVEQVPTWHTCVIQGARATVTTDEQSLTANVLMQTVHDSMIVISVMPMLGIEMARLEATPTELTAIDKMHGRYVICTFAQLNRKLTPDMNWDILQQICSAELPTGSEKAHLQYVFGDATVDIEINYTPRKIDVPVKMSRLRLDKYKKEDITKWL